MIFDIPAYAAPWKGAQLGHKDIDALWGFSQRAADKKSKIHPKGESFVNLTKTLKIIGRP